MDIHFFDCVNNPTHKLASFVESYLYLDGISNKLGVRQFRQTKEKNELEEIKTSSKPTWKQIVFTTIKILSYIAFPPLPCLALMEKAIYHRKLHFQHLKEDKLKNVPQVILQTPKSAEDQQPSIAESEEHLKKTWEIHQQTIDSRKELTDALPKKLQWIKLELNSKGSATFPDMGYANMVSVFKDDPEVFFLPGVRGEGALTPSDPTHMELLLKGLKAAFATGKNLVLTRLGDEEHCVAAAFTKEGEFKIIDSMGSRAIDMDNLTEQLNTASIKQKNGESIHFKGDYVNTYLQTTGRECMRFSTLYLYQIGNTRDLNVYQKVNGAFAKGAFRTFEDYNKDLKDMPAIQKLENHDNSAYYQSFMNSWLYRAVGLKVDDWKEIPISSFLPKVVSDDPEQVVEGTTFFTLTTDIKNPPVLNESRNACLTDDAEKPNIDSSQKFEDALDALHEIALPNDLQTPISSLLPSGNEKRILVREINSPTLKLYEMPPGKAFFRKGTKPKKLT